MTWGWPCCCDRPSDPVLRIVLIFEGLDPDPVDPLQSPSKLVCMDGQYEVKWETNLISLLGRGYFVCPTGLKLIKEGETGYVYVSVHGVTRYEFDPILGQDFPVINESVAKLRLADGSLVWQSTPVEMPLGASMPAQAQEIRFGVDASGDIVVTSISFDYPAYTIRAVNGSTVRTYEKPLPAFTWGFCLGYAPRTLTFDDAGNAYMGAYSGSSNAQVHYFDPQGNWLTQPFLSRVPFNGPNTVAGSELLIHNDILYTGHNPFKAVASSFNSEIVGCDPLDISRPRGKVSENDFGADVSLGSPLVARMYAVGSGIVATNFSMSRNEPFTMPGEPSVTTKRVAICGVFGFPQGTIGGIRWATPLWYGEDGDTVCPMVRSGHIAFESAQPGFTLATDPVTGRTFVATQPITVFNAFGKPLGAYHAPYRVIEVNPTVGGIAGAGYDAPELPANRQIWKIEALTSKLYDADGQLIS